MVHLIETQEAPAKPDRIHHAFEVEDFEGTRATLESNGFEIEREGVRSTGRRSCSSTIPTATASSSAPPPATPRHRRRPHELLAQGTW